MTELKQHTYKHVLYASNTYNIIYDTSNYYFICIPTLNLTLLSHSFQKLFSQKFILKPTVNNTKYKTNIQQQWQGI